MWQSSISGAVYSHTRCSAVQLQVILKHGLKAAFLGGACIWCAVLGGEQRASWPCHCCPPTGTRTQLGAVHRHRGPLLPSPVLLLQLWAWEPISNKHVWRDPFLMAWWKCMPELINAWATKSELAKVLGVLFPCFVIPRIHGIFRRRSLLCFGSSYSNCKLTGKANYWCNCKSRYNFSNGFCWLGFLLLSWYALFSF